MTLDLFYKGVHMGYGNLPSFIIQPGPNHNMLVQSGFVASNEYPELAREFLSRYIAGTDTFLTSILADSSMHS